jgi:hypothetical protein
MSSPAIVKVTGTSIGHWVCDWTQVPFNVSCAAIVSGATGTFTVDVTWDDISGVRCQCGGHCWVRNVERDVVYGCSAGGG